MNRWLIRMRAGSLLSAAVFFSALLSEVIVAALSLWLHGEIRADILATGAVTAVLVSLIVVYLIQSVVRTLQTADAQLLEQKLFLDSILQSTADTMIIAMDTAFRVKYLNTTAERLLAVSSREAEGRRINELTDDVRREHFEEAMRAVVPGGGYGFTLSYDVEGELHYYEAKLSEILHLGQLAGFLLVAHDATDRKHLEETLRDLSYQDGLTGIANRRRFDEKLEQEWRRAAREHQPLSLIMVDIDFFKNFNDLYGHPAGDECLKKIAAVLHDAASRPGDLAGRYGGEEFVAVLPNTSQVGAEKLAEQIRSGIEELEIPHARSAVSPWVTVSVGLVTRIPTNGDHCASLVEGADRALYKAKQQGRNRIVIDEH